MTSTTDDGRDSLGISDTKAALKLLIARKGFIAPADYLHGEHTFSRR
jgi:hypothetical protein